VSGRILAIDPGERRIGIALSDPTGTIASPHSVIDRRTQDEGSEIRSICDEYDVERIVVGLPLHLRGGEGGSAEMARRLAAVAAEATGLPVELVDERFTTKTAEAALLEGDVGRAKRKELRDKVAAAVLLQGYLDAKRDRGHADDDRADGPSTV
jgi:putative Holliday junction resolvase